MNARRLPHSTEIERSLLGGLLLDPSQWTEVAASLGASDFHRPQHAALFGLLGELQALGGYDFPTVLDAIAQREDAERYNGIAYVAALPNACPSVESVGLYAEKVRDLAVRRRVILAAWEVIDRGEDASVGTEALLTGATDRLGSIAGSARADGWVPVATVAPEVARAVETRWKDRQDASTEGRPTTVEIPTGFAGLDEKLQGLHRGDLVILAARPAMGKTAIAMMLAAAAARRGAAVGVISLEMSRAALVQRMLAVEALVDAAKLRTGALDADDWDRFSLAMERIVALPVFIDDSGGVTIAQLAARAARLKRDHPHLGLLVIDYLQLIEGRVENRQTAIAAITRGLKLLAKELGVGILCLSQLNRDCEGRTDKRPMMSDLRESGAIEQDADVIVFLYRDEVYHPDTSDRGIAELIIAKQREGPTGTVRLAFQNVYVRFADTIAENYQ